MSALNQSKLNEAVKVLRALDNPLRLKILAFITKKEAINVNKIYSSLKIEQSITSQHLRILRMAGLVQTKREGKFIYYSVVNSKVKDVVKVIGDFIK